MEIANHAVVLTINLEGCLGKTPSNELRTHQLRSSKSYTGTDGYMRAHTFEVILKRTRKIVINNPKIIQKSVKLSAEFVNHCISFEARPEKRDAPKEYAFWMRMKPIQRLDFYCRILAEDDRAVSYDFEIV